MKSLVDVDHHDDAGLHRQTDHREQPDPDRCRKGITEEEEGPEASHQSKRYREEHQERVGEDAQMEIQ